MSWLSLESSDLGRSIVRHDSASLSGAGQPPYIVRTHDECSILVVKCLAPLRAVYLFRQAQDKDDQQRRLATPRCPSGGRRRQRRGVAACMIANQRAELESREAAAAPAAAISVQVRSHAARTI